MHFGLYTDGQNWHNEDWRVVRYVNWNTINGTEFGPGVGHCAVFGGEEDGFLMNGVTCDTLAAHVCERPRIKGQ